ncbi:MAG: DNA polymerase III subunit alpha [Saprospiraceae bacterium]|nr:DNA polymerase III subunit alpha [Saprospiraceae bacterium]
MPEFCHLHCHTQYSLLDGASDISSMMDKAVRDGQKAVALTDHGNMFGAFKFVAEANKRDIKPIVGCEFYLVEDRHIKSFSRSKGERDRRYHQLLLAKNREGYKNLMKLCSFGFTEGLYQKFPRIDKELIEKYHEGVIARSCCLGAEIPSLIAQDRLEEAEESLKWWMNLFGDDYYIELQRHTGLEKIDIINKNGQKTFSKYSQEDINQILIGFARKHDVRLIATNDSHYVEEEDAPSHDILLCINTNSLIEEETRFKFPSSDFYFKTQEEMSVLFKDVPEAIDNTIHIYDKVEKLDLKRDVLLPAFPLPQGFANQEDYLRHLTFEGAKMRYTNITPAIEERLNFELGVINHSGYPGYFLIVQDLTSSARQMGVAVGPGRGSAAGSAVAYCLGITNIDPIKYDLLFERFLNPERISMPDIDIDFDDEGRSRVIDYVIDKYGKNQVAQIITYGTMAAKMSIRDVGRVMNVPLADVDRVSKAFPAHLAASLKNILHKDDIPEMLKASMNKDDVDKAYQFRKMANQQDKIGEMIRSAKEIEGSVRNTGIHACGVIITPDEIMNHVPVSVAKDSDLLVSQFDNSVAEDAGLLKMDFLGLKTLTIIKNAVEFIKTTKGFDLDIDELPLDDPETFKLFERGETIGIFQYESPGMQKHLMDLKPNMFEDLIAMNALYRPGPLQYIPEFIARKHGRQKIVFDLPEMEDYLAETYGITVYQEQVMLLSQKLAGFSKGEADQLRKAMGKKKKKIIDGMYPDFLKGCEKNGHPVKIVEKIWKDWEAFASYAFNKSHSTCYAYIAFQTAYLKSHYPAEFMTAVLNHNKSDTSKLNFFLRECKRMKLSVFGPDINQSGINFTVNKKGEIRFGLSALKGLGEGPAEEIIRERDEASFESITDLVKRVNLRVLNKKSMESLAYGGALDSLGVLRAQYFTPTDNYDSFLEHLLKFGNGYQSQKNSSQASLFGDLTDQMLVEPKAPESNDWIKTFKLEKEKEVTGIYISGHPLDDYKMELENYTNCTLETASAVIGSTLKMAGIIAHVQHGVSQKNGLGYARLTLQDYISSFDMGVYNEDYEKYKDLLTEGQVLYVVGKYQTYRFSDRPFFKLQDIRLLASVSQDLTKSLTVRVPLEQIDNHFIDKLVNICESHKGTHHLKMMVMDVEDELNMDFNISKYKVDVDSRLIEEIRGLGLSYKVN